MKRLLAMTLCCICFISAQAQQEDKLTTLMNEREQLVMEYQFYTQQNSNFWGKKSKSDLMSIIETLKKIINTDSDLIAAIKEASIKKVAESTVESQREGKMSVQDQRIISTRMADLQSEIKMLQTSIKKSKRTIKDLEAQLNDASELRYGKDKVISVLAGACVILLLYAIFLQIRLNSSSKKVRKKKAVK